MRCYEIQSVSDALMRRAASRPIVLVAIDGGVGLGKSTFGHELAAATGAVVIESDDLCRLMDAEQRNRNPGDAVTAVGPLAQEHERP